MSLSQTAKGDKVEWRPDQGDVSGTRAREVLQGVRDPNC